MNGVGEIDGVCPPRKRDQLAFRCEAEDLVVEQFELGVLEELLGFEPSASSSMVRRSQV